MTLTAEEYRRAREWLSEHAPDRYSPDMTDEQVITLMLDMASESIRALTSDFLWLTVAFGEATAALLTWGETTP